MIRNDAYEIENMKASSKLLGMANLGKNTTTFSIPGQVIPISATITYTTTVTMPKNKCFAISYVNWNGVTFNNIEDFYSGFAAVNDSQLADTTNGVIWKIHKTYSGTTITITMSVVNNKVAATATIPDVEVTILTHFFGYSWL